MKRRNMLKWAYSFPRGEGGSTNSPYKKSYQMNLVSRMRNAGDVPKYCTTLVLIPVWKAGGGTDIGDERRFSPASSSVSFLRFAEHMRKSMVHPSEPKTRQLLPGRSNTLNLAPQVLSIHKLPDTSITSNSKNWM